MEFLITEKQLSVLLEEQNKSKLKDDMMQMYSFTSEMVNKVTKKYKINAKMLLTWGASIGGLVLPLDNFIKNFDFSLSEEQRYLILVGVVFMILYENKKNTKSLIEKINNLGLTNTFLATLKKAKNLRKSFSNFLESSNVIVSNVMEVVSYAFLIPIIGDIQSIIQKTEHFEDSCELIAKRLIASGVVLISSEIISEIVKKISSKFK